MIVCLFSVITLLDFKSYSHRQYAPSHHQYDVQQSNTSEEYTWIKWTEVWPRNQRTAGL
jgi:hypothetical protein